MRSILACLFVVSIGILAALPFRKVATDKPSPPPLDQSQVASLRSPLEELNGRADALPSLHTSEESEASIDPYQAIDPLPESQASLPVLPTSRRPFGDGLVQPQTILPDTAAISAKELAQPSPDWIAGGPLRYNSGELSPPAEAIVESPRDMSIREPTSIESPHRMLMQQAAARGEANAEPNSSPQLQMPEPAPRQNRQRHFIYEPVN